MKKIYLIFVIVSVGLILSCEKDVSLEVDFRDSLEGEFVSTRSYNHVVIDSLGDYTFVTDYTYNYPIQVSKFGLEDLKLQFGSIPDTFSRTYIFDQNYNWSYGNFHLQFFNMDSFKIEGHINSSTTYYNASRLP